jgi:hypothetical protein
MNHWLFVVAAYAIALGATGLLLLLSWRLMRRAEAASEDRSRR